MRQKIALDQDGVNSTNSSVNLSVEIKGEGFPILCLHGHPGSALSLSVFTDHLCPRFKTIAPDLRGYGKSRANEKFQMSDHITDLEKLLQVLNIDRCLLLGWSLGGILALELAMRNPQRYCGLILIAAAAHPRSSHPQVTRQDLFYTGLAGILNYCKPGWKFNIEVFGKRSLFRYLFYQQTPLAYQYLARYAVSAYLQTSAFATQALYTALRERYNRLDQLEKIDCPSLVLAGAFDRHITAASSQETAQHLKNSQWQSYQDTAHLFPWEIPHLLLTDIDKWLISHGLDCL